MQQFSIGQRIKCVKGPFYDPAQYDDVYLKFWKIPEIGEIYTVRDQDFNSVLLEEIINAPHPEWGEIKWFNWHFEPVVDECEQVAEIEEEFVTSSNSLIQNLQKQTTMRLLALLLGLFISFPSISRTEEYNRAEYLPKYRQIEERINKKDFQKAARLLFRYFPEEHQSPRAYALEAIIEANADQGRTKRERMGRASRALSKALQIEKRLRYYDEVDPEVSYTAFTVEAAEGMHPEFLAFYEDLFDYVERVHEGEHSLEMLEAVLLASEDVYYMPWYCQQCRALGRSPIVFSQACAFMEVADRFNEESVLLNEAYPYEIFAFIDTATDYWIFQVGGGADEPPAGFISVDWEPNPESLIDYLIVVHEAVHEKNFSLREANPDKIYGFYLSDEQEYQMAMVDPISGYELVTYIPDSVQELLGSTFDTYFDDPMEEMGSTTYGIYGMMDELNAYMFQTRALQEKLSTLNFEYLSEEQQNQIGFIIAELDNRYMEFLIPIAYYLRMTEELHPEFYSQIKGSALLKKALKEMCVEYENAIIWLYDYIGEREVFPVDKIASSERMDKHLKEMGLAQTIGNLVWSDDPRSMNAPHMHAYNR